MVINRKVYILSSFVKSMDSEKPSNESELVYDIKEAKSVLCFTGSGISIESGLQTFRGAKGIWDNQKIMTKEGYKENPKMGWNFYKKRKDKYNSAEPNLAHHILNEMENYYKRFLIATQNIDGLHQKAGNNSVMELHGNCDKYKCLEEGKSINLEDCIYKDGLPYCKCDSIIRPDVVWFGEEVDKERLNSVYHFICEGVDLCLIIGTTGLVAPANTIPKMAYLRGAFVIDINTENSSFSDEYLDLRLKGKASDVLNELWIKK